MTVVAAEPVSEAIYAVLRSDALLAAAVPGGIFGDVPPDPTFPFLWYELPMEVDRRGFGTGGLPELELRVHVVSLYQGRIEAQIATRLAVSLLKDVALSVTGYTFCGRVFYDETVTLPEVDLGGVKTYEVVSFFRLFVEEP